MPTLTNAVEKQEAIEINIPDDLWKKGNFLEEEMRSTAAKLARIFGRQREYNLDFAYEAGTTIRNDYEAIAQRRDPSDPAKDVDDFCKLIAESLNLSKHFLHTCYLIALTYDKKSFQRLSKHRFIYMSHVMELASIDDDQIRKKLEIRLINERLTVKQLRDAIKSQLGPQRKPGAGRPYALARTLQKGLKQVQEMSKRFVVMSEKAWFGDDKHLSSLVNETATNQISQKLKEQVAEAIETMDEVVAVAKEDREALRNLERQIRMRAPENHEDPDDPTLP